MPTRDLFASWNLVGPAAVLGTVNKQVDLALSTVFVAPGGDGYTQVVSPSENTTTFTWNRGDDPVGTDLVRWRGYWVFMANSDTLTGETSTPL